MASHLNRLASIIGADSFATLGARHLRVLMVVLAHANADTGLAWPATSRIARMAGVDERHARRAMRDLIDLGLLEVAETARARRSRRLVVAPKATDRSLAILLRGRADSAPPSDPDRAELARSGEGAETARAENLARADLTLGGAESALLGGAESAPRTRKEPVQEPVGVASLDGEQARALAMIAERRMHAGNPFKGRIRVAAYLEAGGTLAGLRGLLSEAKGRAGLFWHWLDDPYQWRGVLADRENRAKEARLRRRSARSERAIG